MTKSRLSVSISADLRRQIEEAREDDTWKRSVFRRHGLGDQIEELIRAGLEARASGNLLLLRLDDGLWAWLKAHAIGIGLAGAMEDTAIFMIRTQILEDCKHEVWRKAMFPHLPPTIQKAIGQ